MAVTFAQRHTFCQEITMLFLLVYEGKINI